jgi:hypothetical protein
LFKIINYIIVFKGTTFYSYILKMIVCFIINFQIIKIKRIKKGVKTPFCYIVTNY